MYFYHSDDIWDMFPQLNALVMVIRNVKDLSLDEAAHTALLNAVIARQAELSEADTPQIAAWREAYSRMGVRPTQYRCASEALLRRFRKDKFLPNFHPLVDMLNGISLGSAIPIAAFDCAHVSQGICVQKAKGDEVYSTFQGEKEHPEEGEVIFADGAGEAHSRRWVFRQGVTSIVSASTEVTLLVSEAMHHTARRDLEVLLDQVATRLGSHHVKDKETVLLSSSNRRLEFEPGF